MRPSARRLLPAVLLGTLAACGGSDDGDDGQAAAPGARGAAAGAAAAGQQLLAVEVGSFGDSASAAKMLDSLDALGFGAYSRLLEGEGRRLWAVRVPLKTSSAEMQRLVAGTFRKAGLGSAVIKDVAAGRVHEVNVFPLASTVEGPVVRVKWMQSRTKRGLVIVEDPAGPNGEPVPNAFILATETGSFVVQGDSVWDVAPSPSWRWVAYSRARIASASASGAVSEAEWARLARESGLTPAEVRQASFPLGAGRVGVSQTYLAELRGATLSPPRSVGTLGWRLAWTSERQRLVIGANPDTPQDDAKLEPAFFLRPGDTTRTSAEGTAEEMDRTGWVQVTRIDPSRPLDLTTPRVFTTEVGNVQSRDGWIRLERRVIGPGAVIAATRRGGYIAALVPDPDARPPARAVRVMVYQIVGDQPDRQGGTGQAP